MPENPDKILLDLMELDPMDRDKNGLYWCKFCGASDNDKHVATCVWVRAMLYLDEEIGD
jgi:hypothetical protein